MAPTSITEKCTPARADCPALRCFISDVFVPQHTPRWYNATPNCLEFQAAEPHMRWVWLRPSRHRSAGVRAARAAFMDIIGLRVDDADVDVRLVGG